MSGTRVLRICTAPLLVYRSLFLTLTHEVLMLLSFLLEMLFGVDFTMIHIILVHVKEALSPKHFGGPRFPHRGTRPQHVGVELPTVSVSGRMTQYWIPRRFLTNPSTVRRWQAKAWRTSGSSTPVVHVT